MKNIEKLLDFNGKNISLLMADGTWWVAIKPVCEALGIDYEAQRKNLKEDEILAQLPSNQTVVAGDGKMREMLCLPEKYVYGWLFSIRSESPALTEYKRECYDILYNHFHGALTARLTILNEQDSIDHRIAQLEEEWKDSDQYKEIQDLKKQKNHAGKELKRLDLELKSGQLSLFN